MIGARREVVSTLLNQLRDQGLVSYDRKNTLLVRRAGLERFTVAPERTLRASSAGRNCFPLLSR